MRIGVMFDRDRRPEDLAGFARRAEEAGADDLWVVEDLAWAGGVASAALALAATTRLRVGIGIAPAPLRNPALLAMELATLARVFPGRLVAGIGHGDPGWMAQVGAAHPRKLALLEETVTVVRSLLRGDDTTLTGRAVDVRGVRLVHPPAVVPPVVTGVVRPRSLELSGRCADGTIIAEGQGPARIADALTHVRRGLGDAPRPYEVISFTHLYLGDDPAALDPVRAEYSGWLGIPREDVHACTAPADVAALGRAGAGTVVLRPVGDDPIGQVRAVLDALGPRAV
jgi:alkanesulfonate monooxygenase SsuD/methylene tetrahydromethanopterin reductase-like flavin-dependent oxidoreductase (luciferase family)